MLGRNENRGTAAGERRVDAADRPDDAVHRTVTPIEPGVDPDPVDD